MDYNYYTALRRAKRAEETSAVDTDLDSDIGHEKAKRAKRDLPKRRERPGNYHYADMSDCWDGIGR